jgi:hypothetical protein
MSATVTRRQLQFHSYDDIVRDIQNLRKGYSQGGNWSLSQICWHLNATMMYLTQPLPHPAAAPVTPEAREKLRYMLENKKLPFAIQAPERVVPAATCGEEEIDRFIATLDRLKTFSGPYAPHRIFGQLSDDEGRELSLLHCAHHFSFLAPTSVEPALTAKG